MGEERFDIEDIIREPLDAPVPVWGSADMTCAELYNALWERFCWDDEFYKADYEKVKESLRPLAEYLSAILYERWSRSADIDKEDELQGKIDGAFSQCDLSNAPFAPYRPWFADHNADDLIFGSDDGLSEWLGASIMEVAVGMSGISPSGRLSPSELEEEFIWHVNEREPGTKPCFKASGWDLVVDSMLGEMSLLWAPVSSGIDVVLIERESVAGHSWHNEMVYADIRSSDEICALMEQGTVTRENTKVLVVDLDEGAHTSGYELIKFLEVMELLSDETERFLVFGCEQRSKTNLAKIADTVKDLGFEIHCAPNDEQDLLSSALHDRVCVRYTMRSTYQYRGKLPEHLASKFDEIMAYFEAYDMMESLLRQPRPPEYGYIGTILGTGSDDDDEGAAKEKSERHPDADAMTEILERPSLRRALLSGYGVERFAAELSLGAVELSCDTVRWLEGSDMFDWRNLLVHNLCQDAMSEDGVEAFETPKLDLLRLAHELYGKEGIFYTSEHWYPATVYDDGREEEPRYDEYLEVLERRVAECVESAEAAGIKSSLDALVEGVPAEDILA